MTTPTIMVIQTLVYKKSFSSSIKLALAPICVGVLLASKADVTFNSVGASFAALGVAVTSFYQIVSHCLVCDCESPSPLVHAANVGNLL